MEKTNRLYRGRFAPTPSGPLHFGSLTTAVGSYLQAKTHDGQWLVRIEDIDPPRIVKGATDKILYCLEKYGLYWDQSVFYQSNHNHLFQQAIDELHTQGLLFSCSCSRKKIVEANINTDNSSLYPGTCRNADHPVKNDNSLRIRTNDELIEFDDLFSGKVTQHLATDVGDFIVKRVGGYFAYQLAVVVDDYEQGITEIIRGYDLIDSTCQQLYLQSSLGFSTPEYGHLPLIIDTQGSKLSKQNKNDLPLLESEPVPLLVRALECLGQTVPTDLINSDLDSFWQWAIHNWQPGAITGTNKILYPTELQ